MLSPAEQSASEPAEQQTIQRGLAAAKELGAVAHASAADAHALKSEIHANNNYAGANPYQVAPAAAAELERMTVALNAKMNVITNEVDTLISPPARVRTVYGGAHAVERGSLRPPPAPPPPKVYSVNAPCRAAAMPATSVNRSAAAGGDTGADVSGGGVSGASRPSSTVKVLRHRRDLRCASCYASLGLASVPIDSSRDSSRGLLRTPQLSDTSLLKEGSPSAPRRFEDGAFVRDGLTPGQRALGATGSDQHTSIRELVSRYGKPVMRPSERPPMGRDKRRFAASQKAGGVLDASKQVEAARRRAEANGWLADKEVAMLATPPAAQARGSIDVGLAYAALPSQLPAADSLPASGGSRGLEPPPPSRSSHRESTSRASMRGEGGGPAPRSSLSREGWGREGGGRTRGENRGGGIAAQITLQERAPHTPQARLRSSASALVLRRAHSASAIASPLTSASPALTAYRAHTEEQWAARYSFFPLTTSGLTPQRASATDYTVQVLMSRHANGSPRPRRSPSNATPSPQKRGSSAERSPYSSPAS